MKAKETLFDGIIDYMKSKKAEIHILYIVCICLFGIWMFNDFVSFDAEGFYSIGNGTKWYSQWIGLDRWAFVLLKSLLGVKVINPFFSVTVFLICFPLSSILWSYLVYLWKDRTSVCWDLLIFGLFYISHPIWVLQFAYRNQMEVCSIILTLLPVGMICLTRWLEDDSGIDFVFALVLIIFCFGGYQSFTFMYGTAAAVYLLFYADRHSSKEMLKLFGRLIVFTLLAFIGYKLIALAVIHYFGIDAGMYKGYLLEQILWTSKPLAECLYNIFIYIKESCFGKWPVFTALYSVLAILFIITSVSAAARRKTNLGWTILADLGILAIPFALTIMMANSAVIRSQFAFVLSLAFMAMYLYQRYQGLLESEKIPQRPGQILLAGCLLLSLVPQINDATRLMYTDYRTMAGDHERMQQIYYQAVRLGAKDNDAIVFINNAEMKPEEITADFEVVGYSYFQVIDKNKLAEAMQAYGYPVSIASDAQKKYAETLKDSMKIWPSEGSILVKDKLIIVRLS